MKAQAAWTWAAWALHEPQVVPPAGLDPLVGLCGSCPVAGDAISLLFLKGGLGTPLGNTDPEELDLAAQALSVFQGRKRKFLTSNKMLED